MNFFARSDFILTALGFDEVVVEIKLLVITSNPLLAVVVISFSQLVVEVVVFEYAF